MSEEAAGDCGPAVGGEDQGGVTVSEEAPGQVDGGDGVH